MSPTLRSEIDLLRVEVKSDLSTLRGEFRAELGGLKADLVGLRGELGGLRGELSAAMKADKIDFLKWVMMAHIAGPDGLSCVIREIHRTVAWGWR
jgi:hypothetical protein